MRFVAALAAGAALVLAGLAAAAVGLHLAASPQPSLEFLDEGLGVGALRDEGDCESWRRNRSDPGNPEERRFRCSFAFEFVEHRMGRTLVHQVLRDLDRGRVVQVPGADPPGIEEWYPVASTSTGPDAWSYAYEGSEGAGVFTPPPGVRGEVTVGWVTSNGTRDGPPELKVPRTYVEEGVETVEGIEVVRWVSSFHREEVEWHGQEQIRTQTATTWTDPRNGFTLRKERTTVVEMTPAQMAANEGYEAPAGATGGEPVKVAELTYRTRPGATEDRADRVRSFERIVGVAAWGDALGGGLAVGAVGAGLVSWRLREEAERGS